MCCTEYIDIPPKLVRMSEVFSQNGFCVYLVGGAVRDVLLGRGAADFDLATDATPQDVCRIFAKVIPTGIAHGTLTVRYAGLVVEVTTFRSEGTYSDGRHPDSVAFARTIEEDLSRRDFTMNAIAASLPSGKLVDPTGGRADIERKLIRAVGNPQERFAEDGLRPVRAIRFASQLGFSIDEATYSAILSPQSLEKTKRVSAERFRDEFCKILQSEKPSVGLRLLEEAGILAFFVPQFTACRGCTQADGRGFHEFDVADHLFCATDGAPKDNLAVRLASFYHDIGKPQARTVEQTQHGQCIHFHGHERLSAITAEQSMRSLKFSNAQVRKVSHLVKHHMISCDESLRDEDIRRFIVRVGKDNLDELFLLHEADVYGKHGKKPSENDREAKQFVQFKVRVKEALASPMAFSLKDLAISGDDLIALGAPKGKVVGEILNELFDAVTQEPGVNERGALREAAAKLLLKRQAKRG